MSANKDFKKRRREEEMDDREPKRSRSSDQEDWSRSTNKRRHNNYKKKQRDNYSKDRSPNFYQNNNISDRNSNVLKSSKKKIKYQYIRKETNEGIKDSEAKDQKKKIPIHFTSPKALETKTQQFNFVNNITNNSNTASATQQSDVSNASNAISATKPTSVPALPGYYYDADINRYFKLPPTGTVMYKRYEEVLKKAEEKALKQQEEKKQQEEEERIARGVNISILSYKYKSPLSTIVRREAGSFQRPKEFIS